MEYTVPETLYTLLLSSQEIAKINTKKRKGFI